MESDPLLKESQGRLSGATDLHLNQAQCQTREEESCVLGEMQGETHMTK